MFVVIILPLLLVSCTSASTAEEDFNSTLTLDLSTAKSPNETDLKSDIENYVIVLPNGDIRPAFFDGGSQNWNTEPPLDHIKFSQSRIIGGRQAKKSEVPYQVGIFLKDVGIHCGGALLNTDTVITAAHCFKSLTKKDKLLFVAGKSDLTKPEPGEALSVLKSSFQYPTKTDKKLFLDDIAIVKLKVPFCFNNFIQPIRLANSGEALTGEAQVSGWGYIMQKTGKEDSSKDDPAKYSRQLKLTKLTIMSRRNCVQRYLFNKHARVYAEDSSVFCAWSNGKTEDACQGDSGGPIVCKDKKGEAYLCGIISTGIGCGKPSFPAFFADLSLPRLNTWVRGKTGKLGRACNWTKDSEGD